MHLCGSKTKFVKKHLAIPESIVLAKRLLGHVPDPSTPDALCVLKVENEKWSLVAPHFKKFLAQNQRPKKKKAVEAAKAKKQGR